MRRGKGNKEERSKRWRMRRRSHEEGVEKQSKGQSELILEESVDKITELNVVDSNSQ